MRRRVSAGLWAVAGVCAAVAAEVFVDFERPELPPQTQPSALSDSSDPSGARRRVYRFSVVPGGVWSPSDVSDAIARDPVVAVHYWSVAPHRLRVETLARPRAAFVSYRQGNRLNWTHRPVRLQAGEQVLTDGVTTIRARCGNLVSDQAVADASGERLDPGLDPDVLDEVEPAAPAAGQPAAVVAANLDTPASLSPLAPVPTASVAPSIALVGGTSPSAAGQSVLVPGSGLSMGGVIAVPGGSPDSDPQLPVGSTPVPPVDPGQPGGGTPSPSPTPTPGTPPPSPTPTPGMPPPSPGTPSSPGTPPGGPDPGPGTPPVNQPPTGPTSPVPGPPSVGDPPGGTLPPGTTGPGGTPGGDPGGPAPDDPFVATVPEPSVWWLVACGIAVWWVYRRRLDSDDAPPPAEILVVDRDDSLSSFGSEDDEAGAVDHENRHHA